MSLRFHALRNITVVKALKFEEKKLDPTKPIVAGAHTQVVVFTPVQVEFKQGQNEYTDADVQNAGDGDTIESILKWPTMKALMRKGILIPLRTVEYEDEEEAEKPKKGNKKPHTFAESE